MKPLVSMASIGPENLPMNPYYVAENFSLAKKEEGCMAKGPAESPEESRKTGVQRVLGPRENKQPPLFELWAESELVKQSDPLCQYYRLLLTQVDI